MKQISVYVHFPWCLRKCPYCDFATLPTEAADIPHGAYADAVLRELEDRVGAAGDAELVSVFFGGGTPSLWQPSQLGRVLAAVQSAFGRSSQEIEVTVECNPSSLDEPRAAALREAGVDRLSVGVQSLRDGHLQFLGRLHDGEGALRALRAATAAHGRVSADLMFGMPGQAAEALSEDVQALLGLGLAHISAYALTIEAATPFGALARVGKLPLVQEGAFAEMFGMLDQWLPAAGLAHYEVSNYAREGQESRHNQHYWRSGAYLGLGAAAVGRLDNHADEAVGDGRVPSARRYRNQPDPLRYMERSGSARREVFHEVLGTQQLVQEAMMLGLRTLEGVDLTALGERIGDDPLADRGSEVARLQAGGQLQMTEGRMRVPPEHWLWLDGIVARLF